MRSKLRSERLKREMTIDEVAKEVGVRRSHYNNVELGHSKPSYDLTCKVGKYFGIIDICKLFQLDGDED